MKATPSSPIATSNPTRVLIIDDSDVARSLISTALKGAGFTVFELASPIGATRVVIDKNVDVVVIDVQMPSMSGDRLAALFRRNPRFDRLALVLVSDSQEDTLQKLADTVGANAVVCKRNVQNDLAATIGRLAREKDDGRTPRGPGRAT